MIETDQIIQQPKGDTYSHKKNFGVLSLWQCPEGCSSKSSEDGREVGGLKDKTVH